MSTARPTWQTDIIAAHIDGAFQPGSSCEWTSYGFTVVSTIQVVAERSRVCSLACIPPARFLAGQFALSTGHDLYALEVDLICRSWCTEAGQRALRT
jgi:hypothetical protein